MSNAAVLAEARRRWGPTGGGQSHGNGKLKHVGRVMMGMFFEVKGSGKSWEAAFKNADEKAAGDRRKA